MQYEIIRDLEGHGLHAFITEIVAVQSHYHFELEILYVVQGNITITINEEHYRLTRGNWCFVGSNVKHAIQGQGNQLLLIHVHNNILKDCGIGELKHLTMTSTILNNVDEEKQIIERFEEIVDDVKNNAMILKMQKSVLQLVEGIAKRLEMDKGDFLSIDKEGSNLEKISFVIQYIKENYRKKISIDDVAKEVYISSSHLAYLLKSYTGYTFLQYLNFHRIDCISKDLINTDMSITDIFLNHGFQSSKTFNRVFKEVKGCSPSEYRRNPLSEMRKEIMPEHYIGDYRKLAGDEIVYDITEAKIEKNNVTTSCQEVVIKEQDLSRNVDWKFATKIMCIGRAHELLRGRVQEQVREAQNEIGFEYARFHGIFHDDMAVVTRRDEALVFNFSYIDEVLDFILSIGLKPFLELSFMPKALASGQETIFWYQGNVSMAKDIEEWKSFIATFLEHLKSRYGNAEVESWYFEVWNEPDLPAFFAGSFEDYIEFYNATANTIKACNSRFRVGGPACSGQYWKSAWLERFVYECEKEKMPLDFISCHFYEADYNVMLDSGELVEIYESADRIYFQLKELKRYLKSIGKGNLELHITEWNISARKNNLIHDTAYKGVFMLKTFNLCTGLVDSLAYWVLTDIFEEDGISPNLFHGGFGLINRIGLKKAGYFSMQLLKQLRGEIIMNEENIIVSRNETETHVLAWNYSHIKGNYRSHYNKSTAEGVYEMFEEGEELEVSIVIPNVEASECRIIQKQFNGRIDNIYDIWIKSQVGDCPTVEEVQILKRKNSLEETVFKKYRGQPLKIQTKLPVFGFSYWNIIKKE